VRRSKGWISAPHSGRGAGCSPHEIVSRRGTRATIWRFAARPWRARGETGDHIVTLPSSITRWRNGRTAARSARFEVTFVEVDQYAWSIRMRSGRRFVRHDLDQRDVCNNEVGTVQPLAENRHDCARARHSVSHRCRAGWRTAEPRRRSLEVDLLALSAHKFYDPRAWERCTSDRVRKLISALTGGGHERGRRPGTVNVAGIVGWRRL